MWCQKDPSKAITMSLPPGSSLPGVTPHLLQAASFASLFTPVPDPSLLLGPVRGKLLWLMAVLGTKNPLKSAPLPVLILWLTFSELFTRSILPHFTADTGHAPYMISTIDPAVRAYSPHLEDESSEAHSNWMTCSHWDLAPHFPSPGTRTLPKAASLYSKASEIGEQLQVHKTSYFHSLTSSAHNPYVVLKFPNVQVGNPKGAEAYFKCLIQIKASVRKIHILSHRRKRNGSPINITEVYGLFYCSINSWS